MLNFCDQQELWQVLRSIYCNSSPSIMQKGNEKQAKAAQSNDTAQSSSVKTQTLLNQNCLYVQWRSTMDVSVVFVPSFFFLYFSVYINDALERSE